MKTEIIDFLNETNETVKQFLVYDLSGRSTKPYKLDEIDIKTNWDLDEEDWDTEQTLNDFIEECYIDDSWNINSIKIKCIKI